MIPSFAGAARQQESPWLQTWTNWRTQAVSTGSFLLAITLCGLVFGSIVSAQMNQQTVAILGQVVQHFVQAASAHQLVASRAVWVGHVVDELKVFALLWLAGMSLLGLPVVTIILFIRGFSVGFAVGYAVLQFGWHGFLIATLVIFSHQLLALAGLLGAGMLAVHVSSSVFRRTLTGGELPRVFVHYTLGVSGCLALAVLGAALQVFAGVPILTSLLPHGLS